MRVFGRRVALTRPALSLTLVVGLLVAMVPVGATPARAVVPTPPAGSSVITVKTGGDRIGTAGNSYLEGVTLALYANATATDPIAQPWATCTSDADGDCNFIVPDTGTGGANNGATFVVRQVDGGVPPGWYTNPQLRTGGFGATPSNATAYQFQTPAMQAGQTYRSTPPDADFMFSDSGTEQTASGGIWQNSRDNPALVDKCGLDIALVMDTSASMSNEDMANQRAAADTFIDSLVGTPSRVATFSFAATSPDTGNPNTPELHSVSTQDGANRVKDQYAAWTASTVGGTNWDQAFDAVYQAAPHYDAVIFLTDGNPTVFGDPPQGSNATNTFRDVEEGIFSANAVKRENSRVIAFGVGSGVEGAGALNLRAISGPVAFQSGVTQPGAADYYQTTNFQEAGADLRALAQQQCLGSLSVVKRIVPPDNTGEDISGATNAGAGWVFNASSTSGAGGLPSSLVTGDDGTGAVSFQPSYPPGSDYIDMTVDEEQHAGYTLVTQGGQNAVCHNLETGDQVPVQNTTGQGGLGFKVAEVPYDQAISCVVYNRAPQMSDITVHKRWNIDGEDMPNGEQPDGFDARLMLTGPGDAGPSEQPWGEARTGYLRNESATFDEDNVQVPDPTCRPIQSRVTSANGQPADDPLPYTATLSQEHNSYTVTNTTTCGALLTLVKKVHGGTAHPSDWTLHADGPTAVSGHSGGHDVTHAFVDPGTYRLSESGGPGGYEASGWSCTNHGEPVEVSDARVDLHRGDAVTCTIENTHQPAAGGWTVRKTSDPPSGTRVSAGHVVTYTITARPDHDHADDIRITDDLRRVLNSATFVRGSLRTTAGHGRLSGSRLIWTIPRLENEETLTYQVRVNRGTHGRVIDNVVRPGPGGVCVTHAVCETRHTTPAGVPSRPSRPGGHLPFTGLGLALLSGLAAVLVAGGTAATWWTRRRRMA